ncbi:lipopolysaccharide biosynthesis protein [Chloroflexota bacterium]
MKILQTLKLLVKPSERLSQRVAFAGIWSISFQVVYRLLSMARIVVLARLLVPQDFGLVGMAMLGMEMLQALTRTGFDAALIQRSGDITSYLDTAWTVQVLKGIIQAGVLFLSAPFIATYFNAPDAQPVIQVIAATSMIKAFDNMGTIYFFKDLQLHKQFVHQTGRFIAGMVVAIPLAFLLRNVWALVFGVLAGDFAGLLLSYTLHPYRPRFCLHFQKAKQLFSFGRWVFLSMLITYLASQIDRIVVGKLLGAVSLGLYQMSRTISTTATNEVSVAIGWVAFPAYAKLQNNLLQLRQAFLRIWETTACISLPAAVMLFLLADEVIRVILGPQWLPAVTIVKILAIAGFISSLISGGVPMFKGVGRPRLEMQLTLLKVVVTIALIYPLTTLWGGDEWCCYGGPLWYDDNTAAPILLHNYHPAYQSMGLAKNCVGFPQSRLKRRCSNVGG